MFVNCSETAGFVRGPARSEDTAAFAADEEEYGKIRSF
jgi:hypothetical protein